METVYDLFIIGGGINGVGVARDASGRGLSVYVCEQGDLAGQTSSRTTKLIHGGLRYLEYYDFRLVREALMERERVYAIAPHLVEEVRFVIPHMKGMRPVWMMFCGIKLYDYLDFPFRKWIRKSKVMRLKNSPIGAPLQDKLSIAYVYSDCRTDDARLVITNAIDARERGAEIHPHTRFTGARRQNGEWVATVENAKTGEKQEIRARGIINTAGPWVSRVLKEQLQIKTDKDVRLVQGSHIVVRKRYEGDHAYFFQNPDGRLIFAIPYQDEFTLIGTTDVPYTGDPAAVECTDAEIDYMCECMNTYFKEPVTRDDVVWKFSGVRPLYDDAKANAAAVTRDYVLDLESKPGEPILLSVFGGKITTFRRLAEHVFEKLAPVMPGLKPSWTKGLPLPGGDIPNVDFASFLKRAGDRWPFLSPFTLKRMARSYGTRMAKILGDAKSLDDLGQNFGADLTRAEVDYLVDQEWAQTAEDILWRRSKLGLHVKSVEETTAALTAYLAERGVA
ncbi:MAG: glycerol-3-phosphate dehydrogenase [Methylobacteriaceae bacterium]|jgi:glycerol-3-phosphate dehydrogenase|nr:glycerol-3-phosphate dehydrogenase [Methylobacteriaceae bacterium]